MNFVYKACALKFYAALLVMFICLKAHSQGISKDNFFLTVDSLVINDTIHTLILSKDQLPGLKKVHTNFSWAHVKSFLVYFSGLSSPDAFSVECNGDIICDEVKKMYKYTQANSTLIFVATVENNQGKEIEWGTFSIVVK